MKVYTTIGCLAALLALGMPSLSAQSFGRSAIPRVGACFYEDINFGGGYFCVAAGDENDDLPGRVDDEISSIRVFGNAQVTVYHDTRFRGRSSSFTYNVADLRRSNMNDEISSFRVDDRSYGGGAFGGGAYYGRDYDTRASANHFGSDWGSGPQPRSGACFYEDTNYRGKYFCATLGANMMQVPEDANDEISSIRLFGNVEVTAFEDARMRGRSERFDGSIRDLKDARLDDEISSFRITNRTFNTGNWGGAYGGGSYGNNTWAPSRDTEMTYAEAERIVRRGYQTVLGRDPDPGSRPWISEVMKKNMTQREFDQELMKSAEYRNRVRGGGSD